jgi:hypothetical protein
VWQQHLPLHARRSIATSTELKDDIQQMEAAQAQRRYVIECATDARLDVLVGKTNV